MRHERLFDFGQPPGHALIRSQDFTQADKGLDQRYTDGDCPRAVQDIGRHKDTVFSENERRIATTSVKT